jgi:hypothetical protein
LYIEEANNWTYTSLTRRERAALELFLFQGVLDIRSATCNTGMVPRAAIATRVVDLDLDESENIFMLGPGSLFKLRIWIWIQISVKSFYH